MFKILFIIKTENYSTIEVIDFSSEREAQTAYARMISANIFDSIIVPLW